MNKREIKKSLNIIIKDLTYVSEYYEELHNDFDIYITFYEDNTMTMELSLNLKIDDDNARKALSIVNEWTGTGPGPTIKNLTSFIIWLRSILRIASSLDKLEENFK